MKNNSYNFLMAKGKRAEKEKSWLEALNYYKRACSIDKNSESEWKVEELTDIVNEKNQ